MPNEDDHDDPALSSLERAIKTAKESTRDESGAGAAEAQNISTGMRAGGELIGGIIGGVLFGACADWMFTSTPIGLTIGIMLGIVAGFYGVYRSTL